MTQDISGLSSTTKLTSKPRASMDTAATEQTKGTESTKEVEKFKGEMEQVERAFALVKEIRHSLEAALNSLST
ncbi:MAG: hypothetical protein S4CHLAM2_15390 [Chlamydiales bacterium]|nr:hypothetical protein [Chlamydiales bacterium]